MAALLVSVAVMGVLMAVAMPVWRHAVTREKEAELVFRGEQYARAIGLFMRKHPGTFPPNLDVLVDQKFLRKKYKDPMTQDGEFQLLYAAQAAGGRGPGQAGRGGTAGQAQGGRGGVAVGTAPSQGGQAGARGGIVGVVSKSKEASILLYKGRSHYNEWQFVYSAVTSQPGQGGVGGVPGGRGGMPGRGQGGGPGRGGRGGMRGGPGRGTGPGMRPGGSPTGPGGRRPGG